MVVAVREVDLAGIPEGQRNWNNEHTVYTHGFGFVAAYGNTRASNGSPSWAEEDIPPQGVLGEYRAAHLLRRELTRVLDRRRARGRHPGGVRHSRGSRRWRPASATPPTTATVGSRSARSSTGFLFATKFQEGNILLSERINEESTILYDRDPRLRLEKVAPWLKVDGNPFPAVVNGRIVWILDGYTTLNSYPYAQRISLDQATSDSRTIARAVVAQPQDHVNYARNSVKAVVDAYSGTRHPLRVG